MTNSDLLSPPPTPHPPLHPDISLELSPSKALAHHQQQTAWHQVSSWLSSLYHPSPAPNIERNDTTLHYLQSLMHANLRADRRRRVLHDAQIEQLREYEEHQRSGEGNPEMVLLDELTGALSPEARRKLSSTAKASVLLGFIPTSHSQTPYAQPANPVQTSIPENDEDTTTLLAQRIIDLTQSLFALQTQLENLLQLRQNFDNERAAIEQEMILVREDTASGDDTIHDDDGDADTHLSPSPAPSLPQTSRNRIPLDTLHTQTLDLTTSQKHLILKITEYQTRIAALSRALQSQSETQIQSHSQPRSQTSPSSEITIENLQQKESLLLQKRWEIKTLETPLKHFSGLPPDLEASREEVRRAQGELEEWKRRRERVFEEMGGG